MRTLREGASEAPSGNGRAPSEARKTRRGFFTTLAALCAAGCDVATAGKERVAANTRIVSTSPSMTEMVFALGLGDRMVGRSAFCDYPAEASKIEVVGGFADPNLERIISLDPSLVCGEQGPAGAELVASIERLGIKTFYPKMDGVADVEKAIVDLGKLIDAGDAATTQVKGAVTDKLDDVKRRVGVRSPPRVVLLFDWRPLIVGGPITFPNDMLERAGGKNAVGTHELKYPTLGPEGLIALDPDWILDGTGDAYAKDSPTDIAKTIPGLDTLRAFRDGHITRLVGSAALRPGPRIAEGVEQIARILHADAFKAG